MTTIKSADHFVEVQLHAWRCQDDKQKNVQKRPVIAITRQPGCNGESIAGTLAREFELVLYDWEIVEQIARDTNVSEQVVATLDTKIRSGLDDWLAGFAEDSNLSSYKYMQCLRRILFAIATHGNAVILGRGANFLLPAGKKTLGLCLVAPLHARVKKVMQALNLSQEDALKHITRTERDQRLWVKRHCNADINDATHYHIVINTALVETEAIVRLVREIIKANV